MAYGIGSYGNQPPDDMSGFALDPTTQMGLQAALRSAQQVLPAMAQPQQQKSSSGGGMDPMSMTGGGGQGGGSGGGFMNQMMGTSATPAPVEQGAAGTMGAGAAGGAGGAAAGGAATDAAAGAGTDAAAAMLWIVCTELERQKRLPRSHWIAGARTFAAYPDRVKRGYYIFAIPAVHHLRRSPDSWLSRSIGVLFRARAAQLAAELGRDDGRRSVLGWIVLHSLPPIGHVIGAFVREMPDWRSVYPGRAA